MRNKPSSVPNCASSPSAVAPPCNRDNVIIEFRVDESTYEGEFGFDWLREFEDRFITALEQTYVDAEIGNPKGLCLDGYQDEKTDLGAPAAKAQWKTEYDHFSIKRDYMQPPASLNYRLREVYTAYLNIFPPEATQPAHPSAPPIKREATLRIIKDIKDQSPDRLTIKYDGRYLKLSGCGKVLSKRNDPDQKMFVMTANLGVTLEKDVLGKITIECIKEFPADIILNVYSDPPKKSFDKTPKLAGRLIIGANDALHRGEMKIALVSVSTTKEGLPFVGKHGISNGRAIDEVKMLYYACYQALILPAIIEKTKDHSGLSKDIEIDLSDDKNFSEGKGTGIVRWFTRGKYRKTEKIAQSSSIPGQVMVIEDPCMLSIDANNFGVYLERAVLKEFPNLQDFFLYFFFGEAVLSPTYDHQGVIVGNSTIFGNVDSVSFQRSLFGKTIMEFRQSVFLYDHRNKSTLPHEAMHGMTLRHTHRDEAPLTYKNCRYIFKNGETLNFMSYVNPRYLTWKWQWEIMRKNLVVKRTPNDRSGDLGWELGRPIPE